MLTRSQLRTKLVGLAGGLFVMAVRCMALSGCVLGVRAVNGVGELLCVFGYGTRSFGQVGCICVSSVEFGGWWSIFSFDCCIRAIAVFGIS